MKDAHGCVLFFAIYRAVTWHAFRLRCPRAVTARTGDHMGALFPGVTLPPGCDSSHGRPHGGAVSRGYAALTPGCEIARLERASGMRHYVARLILWVALARATTWGRPTPGFSPGCDIAPIQGAGGMRHYVARQILFTIHYSLFTLHASLFALRSKQSNHASPQPPQPDPGIRV